MVFPFLCPCYILGVSGGPPMLAGKRVLTFREARQTETFKTMKVRNPQTKNRRSAVPRVPGVDLKVGVFLCLLFVFLNAKYQFSQSEKTGLQQAPRHQWTQRSLRSSGYPISPVINHCLVTEQSVCVCVLKVCRASKPILSSTKCMHSEKNDVRRSSLKHRREVSRLNQSSFQYSW